MNIILQSSERKNLPRNHKPPEDLKMFCHVQLNKKIPYPENRIKIRPNLPPGELTTKELISLQRNRMIIIKPCDKGARIII